ncbi:MAG: right-handed parallel beta-helix repeat-containing protein, partial [Pseudomonadota bacterium]
RDILYLNRTIDQIPLASFSSCEETTAEAIQAAIDAFPETGGEISLPPGRIELERTLILRSGVRLTGFAGKTELIWRGTDYCLFIRGNNERFLTNVHIEGLRIRHEGGPKFCSAVFISHAHDIVIKQVEIASPRGTGFLLVDRVYRSQLLNCSVYRAPDAAFMMVRDVRDCLMENCLAEFSFQSGIFLTDLKLPDDVDPMDFDEQIRYTIDVIKNFAPYEPHDPGPYQITLRNCRFSGNRKMGITTDGVGYLQVLNCIITDNQCEGITLDNGTWGCQIQNCLISNNGRRGLQGDHELEADYIDDTGRMPDNSSKAKLPGVSLDNAIYCRVENNRIESNWGDGVKFVRAVHGCTISNNQIIDNNRGNNDEFHFYGVLISVKERQHPDQEDFPSYQNQITNNDIIGAHYAGIHLFHGTFDNTLQNNHICDAIHFDIEDHTVAVTRSADIPTVFERVEVIEADEPDISAPDEIPEGVPQPEIPISTDAELSTPDVSSEESLDAQSVETPTTDSSVNP